LLLGLDVGTRNTGFAYLEDERFFSQTIKQEKYPNGKMALIEMAEQVANAIIALKPTLIGFESYGYKRGFVNTDLGELIGMILYLIRNTGIDVLFLSPMTVKLLVTGEGRATKATVKKAVQGLYTITGDTLHEYDAMALCHTVRLYIENKLDAKRMLAFRRKIICMNYS
jgi:Holliday junction resolvasome RuvABC endonuclease subunit